MLRSCARFDSRRTLHELEAELKRSNPSRFLFSGHGVTSPSGKREKTLGFTHSGELVPINPEEVASAFGRHTPRRGGRLELVFLNGCDSFELGRGIRDVGVTWVICWRTRVVDDVASRFAIAFFEELASSADYQRAFELAKMSMMHTWRTGEAQQPVLLYDELRSRTKPAMAMPLAPRVGDMLAPLLPPPSSGGVSWAEQPPVVHRGESEGSSQGHISREGSFHGNFPSRQSSREGSSKVPSRDNSGNSEKVPSRNSSPSRQHASYEDLPQMRPPSRMPSEDAVTYAVTGPPALPLDEAPFTLQVWALVDQDEHLKRFQQLVQRRQLKEHASDLNTLDSEVQPR
jgi:hypothetical protein